MNTKVKFHQCRQCGIPIRGNNEECRNSDACKRRQAKQAAHGARGGLKRSLFVTLGDERPPLLRLLQDGRQGNSVYVSYPAQWKTLFKAQRLGLIDEGEHTLTAKGLKFLELNSK